MHNHSEGFSEIRPTKRFPLLLPSSISFVGLLMQIAVDGKKSKRNNLLYIFKPKKETDHLKKRQQRICQGSFSRKTDVVRKRCGDRPQRHVGRPCISMILKSTSC